MTQQSRDSTLCDRSQLEDTQYDTQMTTNDSETVVSVDSLEGVVHGLYKLYIFLGDLHRYGEAYNKAEKNYLNASKLGPGLGNPYNQLAVVAFSKDAFCVALYWYARSLLATHEKFSTSSNNLERLFASNREFLVEHGRDSAPTVFQNNANHNVGVKNKNRNSANNNMIRAQKAAAVKSCLTHFVDLHYDLYQQQESIKKEEDPNDGTSNVDENGEVAKLRAKMTNVIASLKSLVEASGFGDALLSKIVIINSFSLERAKNSSGANSSKYISSQCLAKEFLFSLGLILAEQVERVLVKSIEKSQPNTQVPLVRCLLPFELLMEFIIICVEEDSKKEKTSETNPVCVEFWKRVATVGNLVRKILKCHKVNATDNECGHSAYSVQIKEYQNLKGYRPLNIVNEDYLSNEDGFLNGAEAVDVLELSPAPSPSQDISTVSAISEDGGMESGNYQERKAKLLRLFEICEHLALASSDAPFVSKSGNYFYEENNPISECRDLEEGEKSDEVDDFATQNDDEAGDVIVCDQSKYHAKDEVLPPPAHSGIIAPTASFPSTELNDGKPTQNFKTGTDDAIMADAKEDSSRVASTTPIKPPPGFGVSPVRAPTSGQTVSFLDQDKLSTEKNLNFIHSTSVDLPGFPAPLQNRNILDQVIQGRIPSADSSASSFQLSRQQNHPMSPDRGAPSNTQADMLYSFESARSNLPTSVEESIRIFGDMKTANPFVTNPPRSAFSLPITDQTMIDHSNQFGNENASIFPNYTAVTECIYNTDETKWLNSNLLNSLWMAESGKTENP
eukprot:CAMPEP_0197198998 /NCGR_PEP_ID=MMETSP1423-20130617/33661_1 /TAXON_ID=476441 /ORGANISM="Pseudo-nitzschia heimii, Strain UNC1101" /LENGTH=788 /DNA_ID=CAMNT_0042652847 /DNA_START=763 /DNA_END=3129 /DNA_ORIENTATION=+